MKVNWFFLKVVAALLVLAACIYGGYLLVRETDISMPVLFRPAPGPRMIISMDGFRFSQAEDKRASWLLNARSADLYENKEVQLKDIEILFEDASNKKAVLRGASGTMDTISGNAAIRRGAQEVRVVTSDGYLLTTDSLVWKAGERTVWTADPFKLLGSEIYLEGTGISANVDLRTLVVRNNVKAVLQE